MSRALLIPLLALVAAGQAQASDRYGPDRLTLRGPGPAADERGQGRLTWPSREARLRERAGPAMHPARAVQPFAAPPPLPTSIYDAPPPPLAQVPAQAAPAIRPAPPALMARGHVQRPGDPAPRMSDLQPRRYSVVREFGGQPDPIAIPAPSVLAYGPEVAEAVLAQQERERFAIDPGPASPADLDMLERQEQDAARTAAREKTQARNRQQKK